MILYPKIFLINFFGIDIRLYSVCIFLGVLASFCTILLLIKNKISDINTDIFLDFTPLLIMVSIIGARVYYVLSDLGFYSLHKDEIFKVWHGGISIHGAIIFGTVFGIIYFKLKKIDFYKYADVFFLSLPLGQAIGRWGNFFNQEAYGIPCFNNCLIKLKIDPPHRYIKYQNFEYYHPTFLYESVLDLTIFCILFFLYKKTKDTYKGLTFYFYIILYSIVRFFIELIRLDSQYFLFNVPFPCIVSLVFVLIGIIGIIMINKANA